jgi:hypothetical protein
MKIIDSSPRCHEYWSPYQSPGVPRLYCQHVDSSEIGSDSSLVPHWLHRRPAVGQHLCALVDEIDSHYSGSSSSTSCSSCLNVIGHSEPTSNPCSASSYPRKGQQRSGLPESLREWANTYVGLRYSAMLPTGDVSDMPTPAHTAVLDGRAHFLRIDRGHVRGANDATADSRCVTLPVGSRVNNTTSSLQAASLLT